MTTDTLPRVQTIDLSGERYVLLREEDYCKLTGERPEAGIPEPNERGHYPAREAARAIMARDILRSRQKLGLTQEELAKRAGVRVETLCRIERGRHAPTVATIEKLDRALTAAERAATRPVKAKRRTNE